MDTYFAVGLGKGRNWFEMDERAWGWLWVFRDWFWWEVVRGVYLQAWWESVA